MKKLGLLILSIAILTSCKDNNINKSPSDESAILLLSKSTGPPVDDLGNRVSGIFDTTYYTYNQNRTISKIENSLWKKTYTKAYFNQDVNTPYILETVSDKKNGKFYQNQYILASDDRVLSTIKRVNGFADSTVETENYTYNQFGELQQSRVDMGKGYYTETLYQYQGNSRTSEKTFYSVITNSDNEPSIKGHLIEKKYFSSEIQPKAWVTYPFNFGKNSGDVIIKIVKKTINEPDFQQKFKYLLDDKGYIKEAYMVEEDMVFGLTYIYEKLQ